MTRGREPKNRWIGQASSNPTTDIAKLCEAQGAVGIGPVTKAADVKAAIDKGVAALRAGKVCVIDMRIPPGADRHEGASLGTRPTRRQATPIAAVATNETAAQPRIYPRLVLLSAQVGLIRLAVAAVFFCGNTISLWLWRYLRG